MKLLIQIFFLIFLFNFNAYSGESGELPGQETEEVKQLETNKEETIEEAIEEEGVDVSGVDEMLEPKDTEINLPKNRLVEIFDQYFLSELNLDKLVVVGECEKNMLLNRQKHLITLIITIITQMKIIKFTQ